MADPLSIAASVAGLLALAQKLVPLLVGYVQNVKTHPKEFTELIGELRSLCGVLCLLQPIIQRLDSSPNNARSG
jgi:hypothetical protein